MLTARQRQFVRILFFMALIFSFFMAVLPQPPSVIETSDKFKHMLAFATLTILAILAWPRRIFAIAVGLGIYGIVIELVQLVPMLHRDSDYHDWLADMLAIGLVILVYATIVRRADHAV